MIVLVIVLAVLAVIALVVALVTRSRLGAQRTATAAATATAEQTAGERDAERARAVSAEEARDEATARATDAEAQATEANAKAAEAETRAADAAARNGIDPELLWTLERARSERTWRQSVALGADSASVFDGSDHPLREALQIELDAAREDVGAIVDLDLDVPPNVTAAGSVLVLRAAQELLARAVKTAEQTTLHVRADGPDVIVSVEAADYEGTPVELESLAVPVSADLEATDRGVRIRRAIPGDG